MSAPPTLTQALEDELLDRFGRGHNLVVWLDPRQLYAPAVERLARRAEEGEFPAAVVPFRGSFLETLFELEGYANGLDPERLVLHLPGYNVDTVRETPLLELFRAGHRFDKNLATLVREVASGAVPPGEIERFLDAEPDFADAERWLAERGEEPRGGLAGWLAEQSWAGLLAELVAPRSRQRSDGGAEPDLRRRLADDPDGAEVLRRYLHRQTGLDDAFLRAFAGTDRPEPEALIDAFAAWLMAVEYVHDLRRAPYLDTLRPLRDLPHPLVTTCQELARRFRDHHADAYTLAAISVERRLEEELTRVAVADLGRIDTFEREADRVLEAAVAALGEGGWERALEWAEVRPESSFWLRRDLKRRNSWRLVRAAAELGRGIAGAASPFADVHSLDHAVELYAGAPAAVDRAHRHFEQLRLVHLGGQSVHHFGALRQVTEELRRRYRRWADDLAEAFADLCDRHGFLPAPELQQRHLFDQVVHPHLQRGERVALFLVDALRFEMAGELMAGLRDDREHPGAEPRLEARLAELPSITPVGMNALAPVARGGRLALKLDSKGKPAGFATGELTVSARSHRLRAMEQRSLGRSRAVDLLLADVLEWPAKKLARHCAGAQLVVVYGREIDESGESDTGLATFDRWLGRLRGAWHRVRELDLDAFVVTADHGFLIPDPTTTDPQPYGPNQRAPQRRHVIEGHAGKPKGCVQLPLSVLGYSGVDGYHLVLRRDTQVFASNSSATSFAHGGNSPQERVIPVLTGSFRGPDRRPRMERYRIVEEGTGRRGGVHRVELRVEPVPEAQSVLEIARASHVDLILSAVDARQEVAIAVHEVEGGEERHGRLRLPVGRPVTVHFDLRAEHDDRVALELVDAEDDGRIDPLRLSPFFEVAGRSPAADEAAPEEPAPADELRGDLVRGDDLPAWARAFDDEAVARALVHLERHGSLTEDELGRLLGNPRKARRFALRFDRYLDRLPFSAEVRVVGGVKRYVRTP